MELVRATASTERGMSVPGMGDHPTAVALYAAVVTALYRRQTTGEGGEVSTSLLANGLWANGCQVQAALCGLELPPRGERGMRSPLVEFYETSDGRHFNLVLVNAQRQWPLLARAVGHPEWLDDPRFANPTARVENARVLTTLLSEVFLKQPWEHWRALLSHAGITFGLVGRIADHPEDAQIAANGLLPPFADGGGLRTLDSPFQIAGETKALPRMAPSVGQHTRALLDEFG
jgi:formyl-CoA transferase